MAEADHGHRRSTRLEMGVRRHVSTLADARLARRSRVAKVLATVLYRLPSSCRQTARGCGVGCYGDGRS